MSPATGLIALPIVWFFAVLPAWPHASRWADFLCPLVAALIVAAAPMRELS